MQWDKFIVQIFACISWLFSKSVVVSSCHPYWGRKKNSSHLSSSAPFSSLNPPPPFSLSDVEEVVLLALTLSGNTFQPVLCRPLPPNKDLGSFFMFRHECPSTPHLFVDALKDEFRVFNPYSYFLLKLFSIQLRQIIPDCFINEETIKMSLLQESSHQIL